MMLDGLDHPKTLDLSARLDVCMPQAIGHLELLWAFVGQKTPRGNIGKWPDGTIARSAQWTGDASIFVTALHESGFIDACQEHRFVVHDWHDHCPRWVKAKLKKTDQYLCTHYYSGDCSADCRAYSKGSQGKAREGKGNTSANAEEPTASADDTQHESKKTNGKTPPCPYDQIIAAYHEKLPELRQVRVWNDARKAFLRSRWREDEEMQDVERWHEFFHFVGRSDFLMGRAQGQNGGKPFQCDLEWLVRPNNYAKVVEGKYHDGS